MLLQRLRVPWFLALPQPYPQDRLAERPVGANPFQQRDGHAQLLADLSNERVLV